MSMPTSAAFAVIDGRDAEAGRLSGRAAELFEADRPAPAPHVQTVQARLEPAALAAAWSAGRALPLEEAIVLGLRAVTATEPGGMADATRPAGAHALGAG
jgi:hypothetical protein